MVKKILLIIAICVVYYIIGGLATTNMLRLTSGNTLPVRSSKCVCANCGYKITPFLQLPIISYIICKGKCKNCGVKIPVYPLILELIIFFGMSTISLIFNFSMFGVAFSFIFYEIVRVAIIKIKGKRKKNFAREYFIAVISMIKFFISVEMFSLLYRIY